MTAKALLAAVEPSGDALGAALLSALQREEPGIQVFGCGGAAMADAGFHTDFSTEPFAVMGFTDVARALPLGLRRARELAEKAARERADFAVLIDGWAFSRILAKRLRRYAPDTKIYKYVAPQIWASRPQRIDFVRTHFDGVLTVLPFEPPFFEAGGVAAAFVGNPTFQAAYQRRGDGAAFRARHGLQNEKLLAVLPGSRRSELTHLAPVFERAVTLLHAKTPDLRVVAPLAPQTPSEFKTAIAAWDAPPLIVDPGEKYDAFAAADAAIAASGTVTTELAIHETPTVIAYKADPLTAFWARRVVTTDYASILNFQADAMVMPEFIQEDCREDLIAEAALKLLNDERARREQLDRLAPLVAALDLDGAPAADRAARRILDWASGDAP
ncbi:MAG: lipid-A-disaccharide synthase [Pseudomonadota bacterium]